MKWSTHLSSYSKAELQRWFLFVDKLILFSMTYGKIFCNTYPMANWRRNWIIVFAKVIKKLRSDETLQVWEREREEERESVCVWVIERMSVWCDETTVGCPIFFHLLLFHVSSRDLNSHQLRRLTSALHMFDLFISTSSGQTLPLKQFQNEGKSPQRDVLKRISLSQMLCVKISVEVFKFTLSKLESYYTSWRHMRFRDDPNRSVSCVSYPFFRFPISRSLFFSSLEFAICSKHTQRWPSGKLRWIHLGLCSKKRDGEREPERKRERNRER